METRNAPASLSDMLERLDVGVMRLARGLRIVARINNLATA